MHVEQSANPSLAKAMGAHRELLVLTTHGCSCSLYHRAGESDDEPNRADKLAKKATRMGWSAAKLHRAVGSGTKAGPMHFVGLREDVAQLLTEVAQSIWQIGIVIHWYDGSLESETIAVRSTLTIPAPTLQKHAPGLAEDTLIWLCGSAGQSQP
jgi:hypothetical protein